MFNPEMLAAAQKMMANMSPEQMSQIAGMASKMDPNMLKNLGGGNAGLPMPTPAQLEEAKERMKTMSASDMKNMMSDATSRMSDQNSYLVNSATVIKNEGNDKVRRSDYSGAILSFNLALENLVTCPTPDSSVSVLIQSIRLNLALCHLKLEQFPDCISTCTEILVNDTKNIKALYRRGVAHREMGALLEGAMDLKLSHLLSSDDEIIRLELDKTVVLLTEDEVKKVEEVTIIEEISTKPVSSNIEQARSVLESNPAVVEQMSEAFAEMDDAQIDGLLQMSGAGSELGDMKKILKDKDFMKSMTEMMKGMDLSNLQKGGDMSKMMSSDSLEKVVDSIPPAMFEEMLTAQMGESRPSFLTGSRMKWFAKQVMRLIRIWVQIKTLLAMLWSKQGKIVLAFCVLAIGIYYQYSLMSSPEKEDKKIVSPY